MYQLFIDKKDCILEIKPVTSTLLKEVETDEIIGIGDKYLVCKYKNSLKKRAREIKQAWLKETEDRLNQINNIKIWHIIKGTWDDFHVPFILLLFT